MLNILILSQRPLRSNTCALILLASSIAGTITILSGLTSRIMSNWNADISASVRWICKFRGFVLFAFRSLTFWLLMLATIDRWLISSTNVHFRHSSSYKNVLRSIFLLTLLSLIFHCQLLYCYEPDLNNTPLKCFNKNTICRLINDLSFAIITILLPLILISIFGWMTISNIRSSQNRIKPAIRLNVVGGRLELDSHHQRRRFKKIDHHLFIMLFIQVILFSLLTFPVAIQKLYATLTMNIEKSQLKMTIEDFVYQVALLMTYFAFGMQFYVNTLSGGNVFRKTLMNFRQFIIRKMICR
ncbi:unnamed protein product [Rotaria sp. Silwood2]|nr:unnamed protein product [Rotaria sp. Silwood2]CAF3389339.1 unnamed protein product [Rotaria sp. Silwood2]CAF4223239.1 unnamed protein product [Rotaria sp. Silwood2]CAF4379240.1 unnamed protein product [Rotaria sp. Silwood2]